MRDVSSKKGNLKQVNNDCMMFVNPETEVVESFRESHLI